MRAHPIACCMVLAIMAGSTAFAMPSSDGDSIGTLRFADADGQVIALDEPGIVYLVDFWALACKPCIQEMPDLERLAKEYEPGGKFRLVSVVWGGYVGQDLLKVAEQAGAKMTIYGDPENWHDRLDVDGFPTKFFVRDGTVLARKRGGGAGLYDHWKGEVEKAMRPPGGRFRKVSPGAFRCRRSSGECRSRGGCRSTRRVGFSFLRGPQSVDRHPSLNSLVGNTKGRPSPPLLLLALSS